MCCMTRPFKVFSLDRMDGRALVRIRPAPAYLAGPDRQLLSHEPYLNESFDKEVP